MKKYFLFLLMPIIFSSCDVKRKDKISDDSKTDSLKGVQKKQLETDAMNNTTTVQIIDSSYNFGTITEGEKVEFNYRFKNTGTNPLVIFEAHASCGCTVPEKPEKPVLPGETGFIKVVFNSSGKKGHNEKDVNVSSNANPAFPALKLTGEVKEK
jgi:Protein of unknown function (DUF1573)